MKSTAAKNLKYITKLLKKHGWVLKPNGKWGKGIITK